jgi:hypothetical protein
LQSMNGTINTTTMMSAVFLVLYEHMNVACEVRFASRKYKHINMHVLKILISIVYIRTKNYRKQRTNTRNTTHSHTHVSSFLHVIIYLFYSFLVLCPHPSRILLVDGEEGRLLLIIIAVITT